MEQTKNNTGGKERKVLFLDIDGVCNSQNFAHKQGRNGILGIDPYPAFLVGKIQIDTDCEVVLSSTWRLWENTRNEVAQKVVKFVDCTPDFRGRGTRGDEIQDWLDRNPDVARYAILDDDADMLDSQLPNFFHTTWQKGLTPEIAKAVTEHLNEITTP